jgi:hypothetical protein
MAHHPNFSAQLSEQELETFRKLAAQLGYTLASGQRMGEGSPRRLPQELAHAAQKHGLKRTA